MDNDSDPNAQDTDSIETPHGNEQADGTPDGDATSTDQLDANGAEQPGEATVSFVPRGLPQKDLNLFIRGTLTIHYPTRDVRVSVDGDAALRAIRVWTGDRRHVDHLDPELSDATFGWLGMDTDLAIGMHWTPDPLLVDGRVTIDPIP